MSENAPHTVEDANAHLEAVYALLDEARIAMAQHTVWLMASRGIVIDGRLYGRWLDTDPALESLKQEVIEAEQRYHTLLMQTLPDAKATVQRLHQQELLQEREDWVQLHYPDMVERIAELTAILRTTPRENRTAILARHELQDVRFRLQQLWADRQKEPVT